MAIKPKTTKTSKLTSRQKFNIKKRQIKAEMGANSGKTARSVSRHAAMQGIANSISNRNTTVTVKSGSTSDKKEQSNDSTNILGWLN